MVVICVIAVRRKAVVVICVIAVRRKAVVVICVIAVRRKAVVVICVITVRLRHCNTSEPTASVSFVGVTSMDVVRTYVLHVPKNGGKTAPFKHRQQKKRNGER